ncbi:PREDICTED: protein downstream neighbor of son homolog [Papilio xuthus]|uniref:Protein downstream neighbor of son homolog n=1 Tax=Papilio xuthus TaxID=66420 RepID=A0AAJ7EL85_PAPXU|nr:PREDICTED: protein downstream neighbor of son homolog [Papilio xuthus]
MEPTSPWKTPNQVMQLHKLKRRKKALQERMKQPLKPPSEESTAPNSTNLDFSRIINGDKRKNPFSKFSAESNKKQKLESGRQIEESSDNTLFALLKLPTNVADKPPVKVDTEKLSTFSNLLQKYTADHTVETKIVEEKHNHLPIDWALRTKLRLMSAKPFAWTATLKASEEASGITGFVRCLDTSSLTLDTSPRARFHQCCLYWQHPQLPWLQLFPRAARHAAAPALSLSTTQREALHREWTESFRSLFQLVRALHCPYFYLCANTFTCLFRAAGVCGVSEPCALIAPTTRGFRQTLRQEDVEFTMPLRPDNKKRLNTSEEERPKNSSTDSCYDTMEAKPAHDNQQASSGDEEDPDQFLSQLGLETEDLRRINSAQARITQSAESSVDSAAESLVLVRGAEAQALFNFLLNCRSLASDTGALAGVPPTLLAPTAFHGGALQSLKFRENTVHVESKKYYSIELRGPILPSAVPALCGALRASAAASYSATFAHLAPTLAFSWAAQAIAQEETSKENEPNHFTKAFNKENLSDCGINKDMLQLFCSSDPSLVKSIDSVKYDAEDETYSW